MDDDDVVADIMITVSIYCAYSNALRYCSTLK
jgi:hypothetical protein